MLTWAVVTMVLKGMKYASQTKTNFRGDVGCLLILTVIADLVIAIVAAYVLITILR